jgi:hypothetical protein
MNIQSQNQYIGPLYDGIGYDEDPAPTFISCNHHNIVGY